ncbi:MAG: carbohydrate porin [Candidatus Omnitrophota bacterium]
MLVKRLVVLGCMALFISVGRAYGSEETATQEALRRLEARVEVLEKKVAEQDKCLKEQKSCIVEQDKKIAEYESRLTQFDTDLHRQVGAPITIAEGLTIGAGATMVVQGSDKTNSTAGEAAEGRTDASYSADITIGKEFRDVGGKAFLHLEVGTGNGLEDNLTLYSNVNRDADNDNNVRLTELWYEQVFLRGKVAATFGKLDPTAYFDNNDGANDETTQFLARIFRNSATIEFPDNTAGVRMAYAPLMWLEFGYGIFDADSDWEKIGDNLFNISQVTFKTKLFDLPGNYRFLAWHSNLSHTKWLDTAQTKEEAFGAALSFDQKVDDVTTVFVRYGWQDPRVYNPDLMATGDFNYSLKQSWSAGLQVEGKPWGRDNDVLGFAVGQVFPSDDYKKAGSLSVPAPAAKTEGHLEAYYRIQVNDHLSISPDLQYIWNPFGKDAGDDIGAIFVGGTRVQVDF